MAITHVVLTAFKPEVSQQQIEEAFAILLALQQNCIHPTSKKPYIKSIKAGRNNSPEGLSDPYTHAFVAEFESAEDRDYYADKDPAHLEFKKAIRDKLAGLKVVDFDPGKF